MPEPLSIWVGKDEHGGIPVQERKDLAPPPNWRLEAIAATERPRSISISRDGRVLAFIEDRDTSDVWLLDLDERSPQRITTGRGPMPYWEDTTPVLSPDGSQIAYADRGAVWLAPVTGGPPRRLVEAGSPVWLDDDRLIVGVDRDDRDRLAVVEIADPWPRPLVRGPGELDHHGDEGSATVSPDRAWVAYTFHPRADLNRSDIRLVTVESGEARALTGRAETKDCEPAWSPDGSSIVFSAQRDEWYELHVVAADGSGEHKLTSDDADFSEPVWHPDGSRIAAVRGRGGRYDLVVVDAETGDVTRIAPGGAWGTPLLTSTGAVVATYEDQGVPAELRLVSDEPSTVTIYAPAPRAVCAAPHVVPEEVEYSSFDGREIQALLFRPKGASPTSPVAAVVYPHGGPIECYGDEWDGHAQYFVDKGYAWLAPNYRGSTGRGRSFERLNHGDVGIGDTKDCLAAADFLRTLDWVDGDKLGIFGASWGSYLALCAVTDDPEHRFRCAVCKYGECDLLTGWAEGDRDGVLYAGMNLYGHPSENRAAIVAGSPVHRLENVEAPILIAHGLLDERVSPKQSDELAAELRRLGKTFEYVTYPTEAHGFLRAGPQLHFYRRLERFLDWYLM